MLFTGKRVNKEDGDNRAQSFSSNTGFSDHWHKCPYLSLKECKLSPHASIISSQYFLQMNVGINKSQCCQLKPSVPFL